MSVYKKSPKDQLTTSLILPNQQPSQHRSPKRNYPPNSQQLHQPPISQQQYYNGHGQPSNYQEDNQFQNQDLGNSRTKQIQRQDSVGRQLSNRNNSQSASITSPKRQHPQLSPSFNNEQYLMHQLHKSQKLTSYTQKQMIQHYKNLIQTKTHDIEAGEQEATTLRNLYKNSVSDNKFIENGIEDVVNKATQNIVGKIGNNNKGLKPNRQIPLTKDDLRQLQKVDKYRLLKIKNGEIKNKVGNLRNQLQEQYYHKKANYKLPDYQNIKQSDYYSQDNPKTKQANQFINRIRKQRQEQRQRYFQYLEKRKEEEKLRRSLDLKIKQERAQQRRQILQQMYKQKQLKKQQEEQQNLQKKQHIKQWSKIFNKQKPLFIKKQQQFIQKQLIPQIYNRRQILYNIKMEHRPIQVEQINNHDERYMEYKRDDAIRNQAQIEMEREKLKAYQDQQQQFHKGKYRYFVLQEMMNQKLKNASDPREIQRQKKARQIVYADQIKQKALQQFKMKQLKTLNLQKKQFSKRTRNMDGSVSILGSTEDQSKMTSYTDPKAHGKKNLNFLHQLVQQKGIKKDRPIIRLVQQKHVYPDYLQQLHQKRKSQDMKNLRQSHIFKEQNKQEGNVDSLLAKQKRLRQKLKRDSVRKKYNSLDYKQDANIQQNQIDAVRLKMKLINKLN